MSPSFDLEALPCSSEAPTATLEPSPEARETALMARFRDTRDEEVFTELFCLVRPVLLGWIARRAARRVDPAEVLQDTWVNIVRYAGSFRDENAHSFRRWARTIAANAMRKKLAVPRQVVAGTLETISLQAFPDGLQEPADGRPGPALSLVEDEASRALQRAWRLLLLHYAAAFSQLSPRDAEALRLIEIEGHSYEEARALLGVGLSNMKMIVFRARKRLQAAMARSMGDELQAAA